MANYSVEVRILPLQRIIALPDYTRRGFSFIGAPALLVLIQIFRSVTSIVIFSPIFAASWARKNYNALQK
jgi:hypothetical protein